jgi:hypothetical protein
LSTAFEDRWRLDGGLMSTKAVQYATLLQFRYRYEYIISQNAAGTQYGFAYTFVESADVVGIEVSLNGTEWSPIYYNFFTPQAHQLITSDSFTGMRTDNNTPTIGYNLGLLGTTFFTKNGIFNAKFGDGSIAQYIPAADLRDISLLSTLPAYDPVFPGYGMIRDIYLLGASVKLFEEDDKTKRLDTDGVEWIPDWTYRGTMYLSNGVGIPIVKNSLNGTLELVRKAGYEWSWYSAVTITANNADFDISITFQDGTVATFQIIGVKSQVGGIVKTAPDWLKQMTFERTNAVTTSQPIISNKYIYFHGYDPTGDATLHFTQARPSNTTHDVDPVWKETCYVHCGSDFVVTISSRTPANFFGESVTRFNEAVIRYSPALNEVYATNRVSPSAFSSGAADVMIPWDLYIYPLSPTVLVNGYTAIYYRDVPNSRYGAFRLYFDEVDSNYTFLHAIPGNASNRCAIVRIVGWSLTGMPPPHMMLREEAAEISAGGSAIIHRFEKAASEEKWYARFIWDAATSRYVYAEAESVQCDTFDVDWSSITSAPDPLGVETRIHINGIQRIFKFRSDQANLSNYSSDIPSGTTSSLQGSLITSFAFNPTLPNYKTVLPWHLNKKFVAGIIASDLSVVSFMVNLSGSYMSTVAGTKEDVEGPPDILLPPPELPLTGHGLAVLSATGELLFKETTITHFIVDYFTVTLADGASGAYTYDLENTKVAAVVRNLTAEGLFGNVSCTTSGQTVTVTNLTGNTGTFVVTVFGSKI